jgi:hypothetical protein
MVDGGSLRRNLGVFGSMAIGLLTAVLMGNLTVVGATLVLSGLLLAWALRFPGGGRRVLGILVLLSGVAAGLALVLLSVLDPGQIELLLERTGERDSLLLRLGVWRNVVDLVLHDPRVLLVGLGPDVSIRDPDVPALQRLFLGGGVQQQSVDSGYLAVWLDYGTPTFVAAVLIPIAALWRLTRHLLAKPDALALALWGPLAAWLLMAVTQVHGISKPVLFLVTLVALADRVTEDRDA